MPKQSVLKALVDAATAAEQGSIFSTVEMRQRIWKRFSQHRHRHALEEQYLEGTISRREFLQLLGFTVAGAAAGISGSRLVFGDPDASFLGYVGRDSGSAVGVEQDGGISAGDDIAPLVNEQQGRTIYVPCEEYRVGSTLEIGDGTTLLFDGTKLVPREGNMVIFDVKSGGTVGGAAEIDQSNAFPAVHVAGGGQLGDENGRLTWTPGFPSQYDGIDGDNYQFLYLNGSGRATVKNVDFRGPTDDLTNYSNFSWANTQTDLYMQGCDIRYITDNGLYYKQHQGSVLMEDCFWKAVNVGVLRGLPSDGSTIRRTCAVGTDDYTCSPRSGYRQCDDPCGKGAGHHFLSAQGGDNPSGDVTLEQCDFVDDGCETGWFLRELNHDGSPYTVHVADCAWDGGQELTEEAFGFESGTIVDEGGNQEREPKRGADGPYAYDKEPSYGRKSADDLIDPCG